MFESANETGAKLTYWVASYEEDDVEQEQEALSDAPGAEEREQNVPAVVGTADLAGKVMYGDEQHDCPVTVEVIGDHVFLTARPDNDPDRVVQVAVPWPDLGALVCSATRWARAA